MRQVLLGVVGLLMAGSAMASSIDVVGANAVSANSSIITRTCTTCPPLQAKASKTEYTVPTLAAGELQESQIRDVDGVRKLYRTEGFMGGSPVVFVTKAPAPSMLATTPPADGVDTDTTAAVTNGNAGPVAASADGAAPEQTQPLDVSTFKLRD